VSIFLPPPVFNLTFFPHSFHLLPILTTQLAPFFPPPHTTPPPLSCTPVLASLHSPSSPSFAHHLPSLQPGRPPGFIIFGPPSGPPVAGAPRPSRRCIFGVRAGSIAMGIGPLAPPLGLGLFTRPLASSQKTLPIEARLIAG